MPTLPFFTVDVFTNARFGGNPLAVVMGGDALDDATMQAIASEFNLSETTFVLPAADAANTARIRIFNRTAEMAFAGHPMVGTAFVMAGLRPELDLATFEIPAGLIRVLIERQASGVPVGATVAVPRPLSLGETIAGGDRPHATIGGGRCRDHLASADHRVKRQSLCRRGGDQSSAGAMFPGSGSVPGGTCSAPAAWRPALAARLLQG